jgi:hypothetical protein
MFMLDIIDRIVFNRHTSLHGDTKPRQATPFAQDHENPLQ